MTTTFQYDPFGRKVRKIMEDGVHPPQTTRYAYSGGRVLEEQDNTGTPQASYVYGRYIDEPIQMKRDDDTVYYHSDDLYNVTALTNADGAVVERYRYDDFGAPHIYDPSTGDPRTASSFGNPYLFTGRAYDLDLRLYDYRTRHLHPGLGRFTTRDRIGLWGDPRNMGNPYTYVGNGPGMYVDPYGQTSLWNWLAETSLFQAPFRQDPVIGFNEQMLAAMLSPAQRDELMPGYTQEDLQDRGALYSTTRLVRLATNDMLDRINAAMTMAPIPGLAAGSLFVHGTVKASQGEYGSVALDGAGILLAGISATGKLGKGGASACDAAAGDVRAGETANKIIVGVPHGSEPHKLLTSSEAVAMAESGEYTKVYVNRALSTITCREVKSLKRPDVAGVRLNGTVDLIEVVSPSQKFRDMELKVRDMSAILGGLAGPNSTVREIRK